MRISVGEGQRKARGKSFRASQIAALLVFAAAASGTALARRPPPLCPPGGPDPVDGAPIPDHFVCYKVRPATKGPVYLEPGAGKDIKLEDQFSKTTAGSPATWAAANVWTSRILCAPANKNNEDSNWTPDDHPDHLRRYKVKRPDGFNLWTENQVFPINTVKCRSVAGENYGVVDPNGDYPCFGPLVVDIPAGKIATLMVPTAKSLTAPPVAPMNPAVDHFQCYKIKLPPSKGPFKGGFNYLPVQDQFSSLPFNVGRPTRLCAPVNKDVDSGALNHQYHLICYKIQPSYKPAEPNEQIFTANQFGSQDLVVREWRELCVPALKIPGT